MIETIHLIPLAQIDELALCRDRLRFEAEALNELRLSIAANGLRMPVEVFEMAEPRGAHTHGLVSGYRRLAAFRAQLEATGEDRYAAIPAFVRQPASIAAAVAAMVEENEVRADLSSWERGRVAVVARDVGIFASIDEAIERLYPAASYTKRSRLRALAHLAEEMQGQFDAPETLSQAQALRLAAALRQGFGPALREALGETRMTDPESQWQAVLPLVIEAEHCHRTEPTGPARPGRPRRVLNPRVGLTIRREMTRDGWLLRFTGREATAPLMELVMEEIERIFVVR